MDADRADSPAARLTLAQAAQRLGHSEKTLRRWIKSGRLAATLEPGPYGPQYWVSTQAVEAAQQVLSVVAVERTADPHALALAVAQMIERRDAGLRDELAALHTKLDGLQATLDSLAAQRPEPRAPWWRRWWRW